MSETIDIYNDIRNYSFVQTYYFSIDTFFVVYKFLPTNIFKIWIPCLKFNPVVKHNLKTNLIGQVCSLTPNLWMATPTPATSKLIQFSTWICIYLFFLFVLHITLDIKIDVKNSLPPSWIFLMTNFILCFCLYVCNICMDLVYTKFQDGVTFSTLKVKDLFSDREINFFFKFVFNKICYFLFQKRKVQRQEIKSLNTKNVFYKNKDVKNRRKSKR